MQKLIHPDITPPGGYKFIDPDTEFHYNLPYKSFSELEQHVISYREHNSLPRIENFRAVWEAYVCANIISMAGKCCAVEEKISRKFEQYWRGAKAYVKAALKGDDAFVEQKVAEKRAEQCVSCNQNVKNYGHNHLQFYSDRFIKEQVGSRRTSLDHKLFTCKVCTCILRGKVHYIDEIAARDLSTNEIGKLTALPRDIRTGKKIVCWQLKAALKDYK